MISQTFPLSADPKTTELLHREHPQNFSRNRSWVGKIAYLWNGARYGPSCYWPLIGICTRAFDWYQKRWPWMTSNGIIHYMRASLSEPITALDRQKTLNSQC